MGIQGVLSLLPEVVWLGLGLPAWFTLATVAVATVLMMLDRGGPDLIMFLTVCALLVAGVVAPAEAFRGFADPATVVIGVLFVVARAIQDTGVLVRVSNAMFGRAAGVRSALFRLVAPIAVMSAFLNNTPIVAMFVPVGNGFARRVGASPAKFLMPLSFAAMVGGVCTLIGTSTNLVVSGLLEQAGLPGFSMFELAAVGVPTALVALVYLVVAGPSLLPDRVDPLTSAKTEAREYLAELEVAADSPLVGQGVEEAGLRHLPGLFLVEIRRAHGEVLQPVAPEDVLEPLDHLVFTGVATMIRDLTAFPGLTATGQTPDPGANLYEVVVAHHSHLVNRTVRDANFRRRFDAAILAVHRAGERIEGRIGDIVLQAGDTLMLTASPGFRRTWRQSDDFYLVTEMPFDGHPVYRKAPLALTALALMVLLPAFTTVSMMTASVAALLFLVATRCVTP
ncbi:MAG: SLC13 family permease, partial [Alphaproteobacteria bacterium]|nr:SLC13 family permease [Alphaproteobacteria bacterium]